MCNAQRTLLTVSVTTWLLSSREDILHPVMIPDLHSPRGRRTDVFPPLRHSCERREEQGSHYHTRRSEALVAGHVERHFLYVKSSLFMERT